MDGLARLEAIEQLEARAQPSRAVNWSSAQNLQKPHSGGRTTYAPERRHWLRP